MKSKALLFCASAVALATPAQAVPGFLVRDQRGGSGQFELINFSSSGGSSDFNIPANNSFPNGAGDNFGAVITSYIRVPVAGAYTFAVNQDDEIFISVSTNGANQTIFDNGCCSTSTYTLNLDAGVHSFTAVFREFGGGESLEVSALPGAAQPFSTGTFRLLNDTANGSVFAAGTSPADFTDNQGKVGMGPTGFLVEIQNAGATPGVVGGTIDNVNEAEVLIAGGGAFEAGGVFNTINFGSNTDTSPLVAPGGAFPAGTAGDDFALRASGFVDVEAPDGVETVFFHVDGDDGFRLKINGTTVSEFVNPTGSANTISASVLLSDGDFLELFFFERGGGENLTLTRDFDGVLGTTFDRVLVGDPLSGIRIQQGNVGLVPEPASLALLGFAGMALVARRRRQA